MKVYRLIGFHADGMELCAKCALDRYGMAACGICPGCQALLPSSNCGVCPECGHDFSSDTMTDGNGDRLEPVFECSERELLIVGVKQGIRAVILY